MGKPEAPYGTSDIYSIQGSSQEQRPGQKYGLWKDYRNEQNPDNKTVRLINIISELVSTCAQEGKFPYSKIWQPTSPISQIRTLPSFTRGYVED